MGSDAMHIATHVLVIFAALFVSGALAAKVADLIKVPDVVLFLLIGIVAGPPGLNLINVPAESALNQLMLILGASFLLFHGGTGVSFRVLKQVWLTLTLLSTVAVLLMTVVVGYTAHYALGLSLVTAMLLAAVLASTDPATLVPIFLAIRIRDKVAQTVLSESALNDATGSICTFAILGVLSTGEFSIGGSLWQFVLLAGGGILVGIVFGMLSVFLVSNKAKFLFADYAQVLLLPVIIASYLVADRLGASGFMAVFVVGLIYGNMEHFGMSMPEEQFENLHGFINNGSLLLRMVIFILLGAHVDFAVVREYLLPGCAVIAVFMLVARPLSVLICALPDRKAKWTRNEIIFMFWTRETGVIPAALSGMLIGMGVKHADVIAAITFMAILATLVIQASTTKWLAGRLGLLEDEPVHEEVLHHQTDEQDLFVKEAPSHE
ncbi:MAG: sodium:proton antiporter [Formivibrio sp.]|nr:sodium:proton antiporter [Formivibrio sp.]